MTQEQMATRWEKFGGDHCGCFRRTCRCGKVFYSLLAHGAHCSRKCKSAADREPKSIRRTVRRLLRHAGKLGAGERFAKVFRELSQEQREVLLRMLVALVLLARETEGAA